MKNTKIVLVIAMLASGFVCASEQDPKARMAAALARMQKRQKENALTEKQIAQAEEQKRKDAIQAQQDRLAMQARLNAIEMEHYLQQKRKEELFRQTEEQRHNETALLLAGYDLATDPDGDVEMKPVTPVQSPIISPKISPEVSPEQLARAVQHLGEKPLHPGLPQDLLAKFNMAQKEQGKNNQ